MGIVGMPNVGKSTLFNALTRTAAAQAANFPFCTIEPNVGEVGVPDARLETLAKIAGSQKIIPTRMTFVDIAGLVKGASKARGWAISFWPPSAKSTRLPMCCAALKMTISPMLKVGLIRLPYAQIIETELMLADMESIEKRLQGLVRKVRGGDKDAAQQERLLQAALTVLEDGKPARVVEVDEDDSKAWGHAATADHQTDFVCL